MRVFINNSVNSFPIVHPNMSNSLSSPPWYTVRRASKYWKRAVSLEIYCEKCVILVLLTVFLPLRAVSSTTLSIPPQPFIRTCWTHHHFLLNRLWASNQQKRPYLSRDIMKET
jgi:hypothetical protein